MDAQKSSLFVTVKPAIENPLFRERQRDSMARPLLNAMMGMAAIGSLLVSQAYAAVPSAARLTSVDGPVLVNQGFGFAPVGDRTVLHPGDRLLSMKGARALLIYANGCAVALRGGAMVTVSGNLSCKSGKASLVSDTDFTGDQAQAAAIPAVAGAGGATAAASTALSLTTVLAVTTGVVGVGLGTAVATGAIGKKTTSP